MVNENQSADLNQANNKDDKPTIGQADALEGKLSNMLSGVERSLAVTCESIMGKMKQLEDKMNDMEKRYNELAQDAEKVLKETTTEPKSD